MMKGSDFTLDQLSHMLSGQGLVLPAAPMMRPPVPGVLPALGQGVSQPSLQVQEILALMAQPKLGRRG